VLLALQEVADHLPLTQLYPRFLEAVEQVVAREPQEQLTQAVAVVGQPQVGVAPPQVVLV
tara:strand:+ start:1240 stop:1419 length:180 start_codon:yes stop_codon:yes gene_type:complete